MTHPLDRPLAALAANLRRREVSAAELVDEAIRRHEGHGSHLRAYKFFDTDGARTAARRADGMLARGPDAPPLCGLPVSVKDLYGVDGLPTFAGTAHRLPRRWERDAWLVARVRAQGAVVVGKTHTVELAYGAIGINPHWGTPWNPWDPEVQRIPGGSSSGAGVSLHEGSAVLALGTDTGGSIRIPASMTGVVGHKTTKGRWPTEGVVPLSGTLDTVGGLARSVADATWFFGSVDPRHGNPEALLRGLAEGAEAYRVGVARCRIRDDCAPDIADRLDGALGELEAAGWSLREVDADLLDRAVDLYLRGGIAGVECLRFLEGELPDRIEGLHPIVGRRIRAAALRTPEEYTDALAEREILAAAAPALFDDIDALVLPGAILSPPPVDDLRDMDAYVAANTAALRPTSPANILGLCALTLPVGLDDAGLPVGMQLVAPGRADEALLGVALAAEGVLGTGVERLGMPPAVAAARDDPGGASHSPR